MKSIRGLVERAMGYNEDRGDSLEVQSLPLMDISSNADTAALQEAEAKAFYLELARYGLAGLVLFLLVWFVLRPVSSRFLAGAAAVTEKDTGGSRDDDAAAAEEQPSRSNAVEAALKSMQLPALGLMKGDNLALQSAARELITRDPKVSARIIQQWTRQI